ncbi:MAG: hypothetical protein H6Q02_1873, partial [Acidobacteria bacterium]|nr:hypothetical protein [Acidobacteriota bacterium]
ALERVRAATADDSVDRDRAPTHPDTGALPVE